MVQAPAPKKEPAFQLQITNKSDAIKTNASFDGVNKSQDNPTTAQQHRNRLGSGQTDEETQTNTRVDARSPVRGTKES